MNPVKLLVQAIELAQSSEYWTPLIAEALPSVRLYHISIHDQDEFVIRVSLLTNKNNIMHEFLYGRHIGVTFADEKVERSEDEKKLFSDLSNFTHLDDIVTLIQAIPNFRLLDLLRSKQGYHSLSKSFLV